MKIERFDEYSENIIEGYKDIISDWFVDNSTNLDIIINNLGDLQDVINDLKKENIDYDKLPKMMADMLSKKIDLDDIIVKLSEFELSILNFK
jgi:beta-glucosidase/6-phospho-beta-glucosidase/beta-galactosidase